MLLGDKGLTAAKNRRPLPEDFHLELVASLQAATVPAHRQATTVPAHRQAAPGAAEKRVTLPALSEPAPLTTVKKTGPVKTDAVQKPLRDEEENPEGPGPLVIDLSGMMIGPDNDNSQWQLQKLVTRSHAAPQVHKQEGLPLTPVTTEKADGVMESMLNTQPERPVTGVAAVADGAPQVTSQSREQTPETAVAAVDTAPPATISVAQPVAERVAPTQPVQVQATVSVNHAPETPEWTQAVSRHIAVFCRDGIQNAAIRLHPEELGSLHITLRIQQDQAQIHILSEHQQVRHVMEQAIPQLRTALAETGLQLEQASVSDTAAWAGREQEGEAREGSQEHTGPEAANTEEDMTANMTLPVTESLYGISTFA